MNEMDGEEKNCGEGKRNEVRLNKGKLSDAKRSRGCAVKRRDVI